MDLSEYPDYDFTFLDGTSANDLTALGRGLEAAASDLKKTAAGLAASNKTTEVDKVYGDLVVIRQQLESQATAAVAAGAAVSAMKRAADTWKKTAPTRAELEAADTAVKQASAELSTTANSGASGAEVGRLAVLLQQARDRFRDLRAARDSADKALVEAFDKVAKSLGGAHKKDEKRAGNPTVQNLPGGKPNPAAPAPSAAPAPAPAARSTAALPGTAPAPVAAPSPATSPSSANEAAIAALMADQRRAGQPVQIPQAQPQQAPAAPAPTVSAPPSPQLGGGSNPKQDKSEAVTSEDLDRAIGSAPAALPVLGPAAGITQTSPASPAATPAAAPAPATTGTSVAGLHTDAPVSGRTDGPRTALAAGTPENATRVAPQANPSGAHPAGAPMGGGMPMVPGMGGGGGNPSRKQNAPVTKYTPETAELNGHETLSEAVRGGTIAQNLPDRAE